MIDVNVKTNIRYSIGLFIMKSEDTKIVPIHPNKGSKPVPYKFVCLHEFMGIYIEDDGQQIPSLDYEKALRFINRWGQLQADTSDDLTFVNFEATDNTEVESIPPLKKTPVGTSLSK